MDEHGISLAMENGDMAIIFKINGRSKLGVSVEMGFPPKSFFFSGFRIMMTDGGNGTQFSSKAIYGEY